MSETKMATKADLKEMYDRMLPYLGGMPEMLANKFSKGDLYSTDEKMIGQWIDGKPLYQKTIVKNNFTIGNDTSFTHGITNVDKIFIKEGFIDDNGSFVMMPLLWSTTYNGVLIDATRIVFKGTGTWGAQLTRTLYIVIQYTKTTDSAISIGDDTDYSTDEKIVGTWIDGKPIWQKTFAFNVNQYADDNDRRTFVLLEQANVDSMIDFKLHNNSSTIIGVTMQGNNNPSTIQYTEYAVLNNNTMSVRRQIAKSHTGSPTSMSGYATIQYTKTT